MTPDTMNNSALVESYVLLFHTTVDLLPKNRIGSVFRQKMLSLYDELMHMYTSEMISAFQLNTVLLHWSDSLYLLAADSPLNDVQNVIDDVKNNAKDVRQDV